jgi:MFS family permease
MGLSAIQLGLVFTGWGALVAIFSVFGAPWLQSRLGIARTLYANLFLFALVVLIIAIWTNEKPVLISAVIAAGIFIGVNNTVTTQAVMTVAPVERPVASAAYGFVRFIGGGLAPYAAGKLVEASNIHVPFYIGAGALVLGIGVLSTGHRLLGEAERVQAAMVGGGPEPTRVQPAPAGPTAVVTVPQPSAVPAAEGAGTIVAAINESPVADRVTAAAGRLASAFGQKVHVLHARETAVTAEMAEDTETLQAAEAVVRKHLDQLAASGVSAVGHVLLSAADHGAAGRMVAEHANSIGARTIVIGAPTHGGLLALMDGSASREMWRYARSHIVIVNPTD